MPRDSHLTRSLYAALAWMSLSLWSAPSAHAEGGFTPEAARGRMVVPEGFAVEVFASEPMIRQPVAACFDERGRLWVIEYLQYPNPAGLTPVKVDQYLRTEYDRFPEPPPHGPRGADRIKILEDTDGDGKADRATVFVEGLNLASGLAVGNGGVYVGQAPYLLFYPDKDRDDRPDGDPEVLLTGFGLQDAHATVNSLAWGPDGWLYGAQGSTVTARIRGVEFQQGIWRYHPPTRRFELFAEGGGNTWGLDFDLAGNAFGSSNGSFIAFHMVQGGNYWKGFAKHGPLHNPHAFGYFDAIPYQGPKSGGHVTPGGIIYKGDAYPESFRGRFIGGNLLSNAVYWHDLSPLGSTFGGRHGGTLIDSRDQWFRPIDLLTGPDGNVLVVDWYDKRASHLDPRDNWDKTNGRIYRVVHRQPKRVPPFDLAQATSVELVALRTSPNDWHAAMARRLLAERRDPGVVPILKESLASERDETRALRDLWALHVTGGLDDQTATRLLDHHVAAVRRWTIRLLGDDQRMNDDIRSRLLRLAATESDPLVRSQLASSCQRWAAADALPIVRNLLERSEDRDDIQIPLLLWWALEHHLHANRDAVVDLIASPDLQSTPIVQATILERVARVLVGSGEESDDAALVRLVGRTEAAGPLEAIAVGIEKGLEGRRLEQVPIALVPVLRRLWDGSAADLRRLKLAIRLGSPEALRMAIDRALAAGTPATERVGLIEVLGQRGQAESREALLKIVSQEADPAVQLAAVTAVGRFDDTAVAEVLLARYMSLTPQARDRARDVLVSRRGSAERLLRAIADGSVPSADLRAAQVVQIAQLGDPELIARVESAWGRIPGSNTPEKVKRIAEVRGMLPEGDKGRAERGALVYRENCAACHRLFGEGEVIGPELTGAERGNLDFLLTSLVDPSALIRKEYQAQVVALEDGRVLNGLIVEEGDRTITLFDSNRQRTIIDRDAIESIKPSPVSLMPEGLLDKLGEDQVRDLFRYLQSGGPPPAR